MKSLQSKLCWKLCKLSWIIKRQLSFYVRWACWVAMVEMHVLFTIAVCPAVRQLTGSQSFFDLFSLRGLNLVVIHGGQTGASQLSVHLRMSREEPHSVAVDHVMCQEGSQWRRRRRWLGRRSRRSGWGSAWLRGTAAGCWRRCSRTRGPRAPWIRIAPAAPTQSGPAPPPPAERRTRTSPRAASRTSCWRTRGPPRTGCSRRRGSTYSVKMGPWGGSSTKSAQVRRCLRTFSVTTV